ncbi:AI-2E family transporter [Phytohabitans suffuscus]|uniref:AI-2E family transporter n=1 Tax=Phytohabitans suffuscus TaxID=624315 RepID=A0A6F8Z0S4_9ACTN|nr:AI-2E family transporter [Phytohabitans suffuscus]BCB91924.1 AI-2E family transporter [Phytohabitans suffuscus]
MSETAPTITDQPDGPAAGDPMPGPRAAEPRAAAAEGADGGAEAGDDEAEGADDGGRSRFGKPGAPLSRSPFVVGFTAGLGLLLAYALFMVIQDAASILILIFIALFLAVGLHPAVVRLQRWGLPRGLAVAGVGLGVLVLLAAGMLALVPPVVTQTSALVENLPSYIDELRRSETLRDLNEQYQIIDRLQSAATASNMTRAAGGVLGGAQVVFGAVFNVLTVVVLTIYFLAAFDRLRLGAYKLVPASRRVRVQAIGDEILAKVGAFMAGALAIALIAGVATWVFLMILGVTYPFALAVVVAVCDLIPQVGATLGAVVVSAVGFATAGLTVGIVCVVFFIVYQQLENFVIYPKVMRRAVKVSDLAAILAALLGIALLGVVGALIAIPAVAAIQLVVREVVLPRQERG